MTNILTGTFYDEQPVPTVQLKHNPCDVEIVGFDRTTNDGEVIVTINKPILNTNTPARWYVANNNGARYAITQISQTQFAVNQFAVDGTPTEGICQPAIFELFI